MMKISNNFIIAIILSYILHTSTPRPRNNVSNKNLINEDEIIDGFNKVIKKSDKVIVLYSGLWSFILGTPVKGALIITNELKRSGTN